MRLLKSILAVLLVWTVSFQAMAGVMGSSCRHPVRTASVPISAPAAHHAGMHHAGPMAQQAGPHAHHAMGSAVHATAAKNILRLGCACGCDCMKLGCGNAGPGLAMGSSLSAFDFSPDPLRAALAPSALAKAHILDLIRPPSMS